MKTIIAVLGAVLIPVAAGTPAAADTGLSRQDCGDGLQCSRITVPADWAAPKSEQITLGLAKLPASDPAAKKGTLVPNMGGPAQQISILRQTKNTFADLTRWFDVLVFDPRGFEASTEVRCPDPAPWPTNGEWIFPDRTTYAQYMRACPAVQPPPLRLRLHSSEAFSTSLAHRASGVQDAGTGGGEGGVGRAFGVAFGDRLVGDEQPIIDWRDGRPDHVGHVSARRELAACDGPPYDLSGLLVAGGEESVQRSRGPLALYGG